MAGALITVYLYGLFVVWIAFHTWKNYDAISMFSPWKWICGSSNSAYAFKVLIVLLIVFALLMLEGYMESMGSAL